MAAEALHSYVRSRLPYFAILYPRHRFGYRYRRTAHTIYVIPPIWGSTEFISAIQLTRFQRVARKVRASFYVARLLADHIDDLLRSMDHAYHRIPRPIEPVGIEAADPARVHLVLERARGLIDGPPEPDPVIYPPQQFKPWRFANEGERREMLKDCGWL